MRKRVKMPFRHAHNSACNWYAANIEYIYEYQGLFSRPANLSRAFQIDTIPVASAQSLILWQMFSGKSLVLLKAQYSGIIS